MLTGKVVPTAEATEMMFEAKQDVVEKMNTGHTYPTVSEMVFNAKEANPVMEAKDRIEIRNKLIQWFGETVHVVDTFDRGTSYEAILLNDGFQWTIKVEKSKQAN